MRSLRPDVSINAGSMADIAFLLLLFFLVATSIEPDKGIQVLLPVYTEDSPPILIDEKRVLSIRINAINQVMVEDRHVVMDEVTKRIRSHLIEYLAIGTQPIISIVTDTAAVYDTYLSVYDNIKKAYNQLRREHSQSRFSKDFERLDKTQKREIIRLVPMIISESDYF